MKIIYICLIILSVSCKNGEVDSLKKSTIISISGYRYYNITFDESGKGVAKIGRANDITDALLQKEIEDSLIFKVDSVSLYFKELEKLEKQPYIGEKMLDANHVLIYSNDKKVFDSYRFDSNFWGLMKIIGDDIPNEFNPFKHNENR